MATAGRAGTNSSPHFYPAPAVDADSAISANPENVP